MALKQPPEVNGIMDLTEDEVLEIQAKLQVIVSAFEPTDDQFYCDTFYMTAEYNRENEAKINGDTASYCLYYSPTSEV